MKLRVRWHRTATIALAVAFLAAVLVHEREVSLIGESGAGGLPLGWLVVFGAAAMCFLCGASSRSTPQPIDEQRIESAPD